MERNQVRIDGRVSRAAQLRQSPAGIPIAHFVLDHQSEQTQAGLRRQSRFRIAVVAAGAELAAQAGRLQRDDRVRVSGFLSRADSRSGDQRLVIHAQQIEYAGLAEPAD
ncbi:primosomal replication protein N [Thiohalobacter sp. COW1]|uniref:Replication restart protein PriB n=1 Tax=Thiohalobacter thiocyanaticus TaxID=585455 RepID=A0A1Z4VT92_9GAMM|nr:MULTISPECIES: primosomal replication protein N [Thiohalobacter]BAZ94857.1 primosomal replication protein N [Thiohalobacter thiocyanaticus]BCO33220.1 primosomal replication protein N [Thiohalobacter sp. COW1]